MEVWQGQGQQLQGHCPAAPLMKYISFISPPEKGKTEHATFFLWSGSIVTTEVSLPVLSACLVLTGFGLELSPVCSAQSIRADIFSSATWILFSAVILYENKISVVTRSVRIDKFFLLHEKTCMYSKQWKNLSIGRCVEAEPCITSSMSPGKGTYVSMGSVKFTSRFNCNKS